MTDFLLMVSGALFAIFVSGIVNYGKRTWVGLTDDEISSCSKGNMTRSGFARTIEAKLKEKNT